MMCLEPTLGVITACIPFLKPIFVKLRDSIEFSRGNKGTTIPCKPGSVPIFMRASHMWASMSEKSSGRGMMDSDIPIEDWRRSKSGGQSTSKTGKALGVKASEIQVQKDIDVESEV